MKPSTHASRLISLGLAITLVATFAFPGTSAGPPPTPKSGNFNQGDWVIGSTYDLPSQVLGEDRPLLVKVPPGGPNATFDVVVVLDAETHATHVAGMAKFLAHPYVQSIRRSIVVGVINTDRLRDTTPTATAQYPGAGGVRAFLQFLDEELLPWIHANHSTTGRTTLVGHSGSALAAMYALLERPQVFDDIIAVDPSLGWDDEVFFQDAAAAWSQSSTVDLKLKLSSYRDKETIKQLIDLLHRRGPSGLTWDYQLYPGETHNSMVHRAVYDALIDLHH